METAGSYEVVVVVVVVVERWDCVVWTGLMWLRIGTSAGLL
jgi:hypothetical protein